MKIGGSWEIAIKVMCTICVLALFIRLIINLIWTKLSYLKEKWHWLETVKMALAMEALGYYAERTISNMHAIEKLSNTTGTTSPVHSVAWLGGGGGVGWGVVGWGGGRGP